jgi:hypothetical protein
MLLDHMFGIILKTTTTDLHSIYLSINISTKKLGGPDPPAGGSKLNGGLLAGGMNRNMCSNFI